VPIQTNLFALLFQLEQVLRQPTQLEVFLVLLLLLEAVYLERPRAFEEMEV
jgi:hypothetical protein